MPKMYDGPLGGRYPAAAHVVYRHPPLEKLIVQVAFSPPLPPSAESSFRDGLAEEFPTVEASTEAPLTTFWSPTKGSRLVLSPDFLSMEIEGGLSDVREQIRVFERPLRVLEAVHPAAVWRRSGWRFVNLVPVTETMLANLSLYVNPVLVAASRDPDLGPCVVGQNGTVTMQFADAQFATLRHGLEFKDGPGRRLLYRLDVDYWSQPAVGVSPPLSAKAVGQHFADFYEFAWRFFRWCLTDVTCEGFGPVPDGPRRD